MKTRTVTLRNTQRPVKMTRAKILPSIDGRISQRSLRRRIATNLDRLFFESPSLAWSRRWECSIVFPYASSQLPAQSLRLAKYKFTCVFSFPLSIAFEEAEWNLFLTASERCRQKIFLENKHNATAHLPRNKTKCLNGLGEICRWYAWNVQCE